MSRSRFADPSSRELPGVGDSVLVVGLARQGQAMAARALELGARVRVADMANTPALRERAAKFDQVAGASVFLGNADPALLEGIDLVLASATVPPAAEPVASAVRAGVPVWSDAEPPGA